MRIGFNEATARDCSDLETDVKLCDAAGFDAIELRIDMIRAYLREHNQEELANLFCGRHIVPINLNAIYPYAELFSDADSAERREQFLSEFDFACEMAQFIGANALILCPPLMAGRKEAFPGAETEWTQMNARIVGQLADRAALTDTRLCFEIVGAPYSSCRTVAQALSVLRAINRPNVGLAVDSYNIYMGNQDDSFADLALLRSEEIYVAHINDADYAPPDCLGDQSRRCFCGAGVLDLHAYLNHLKEIGYDGVVSVETFRPEYWAKSAEWVIAEAYRSTRTEMERACCRI